MRKSTDRFLTLFWFCLGLAAATAAIGCRAALPAASDSQSTPAPSGEPAAAAASRALDIASDRNARVAIDTAGGTLPLVYLAGEMDEATRAEAQRLAPNIEFVIATSREQALTFADRVHGIDGQFCTPEFLEVSDDLVWVQSTSAGVERYLRVPKLVANDSIVLTNMRGVHGAAIADHAFAMLLTLTRDIGYYTDGAHRGTWNREGSGSERIALAGRTLLVVGLGGIGSEVAQRGKGFGMRVLATRRTSEPKPDYVDAQGTPADLVAFLQEADVVVICVPLTAETQGMIGSEELAAMKPGGYIINIARGRVIETAALVDALRSGHLAGAGLDVTDPEPLPADHVLWTLPNVVITPHMSADSKLTDQQWTSVYLENLRRFGAGEPLLNVVDKQAGY